MHSREVYARALEELGEQAHIAKLFMAFAALEQKAKEVRVNAWFSFDGFCSFVYFIFLIYHCLRYGGVRFFLLREFKNSMPNHIRPRTKKGERGFARC